MAGAPRSPILLRLAVAGMAAAMSAASPAQTPPEPAPLLAPAPLAEPMPPAAGCGLQDDPLSFFGASPSSEPTHRHWLKRHADLRSSVSHGRAMGPGEPLRGTSWLNRPLWFALDGGVLLMTDGPAANVRSNNDLLGAVSIGWDFDYYWGVQTRVTWSTPELLNTLQPTAESDDNLFVTDLSLIYYPWGDSRLRPYYRVGLGLTDLEYTNDFGVRQHEQLLTAPFGVGLKYQVKPNCALRLELMDNLAFGQNETSTLNNFTVTGGLEWRFGGRPSGYWAWAPRGGAW